MTKLAKCPCGQTPIDLGISEGYITKYADVYGNCCGEWRIEFYTEYSATGSDRCMELAIEAWNNANRGFE